MNRIWKRYFFSELLKVFVLFMACFYFLYVLIDYSVHAKALQNSQVSFLEILVYYAFQFTKRADILVPVALLVAAIKVLATSNVRNEIVALTTGGISLKQILSPFLAASLLCQVFLYANFQWMQPLSLNKIETFEECHFKERGKGNENKKVHALILEDNTLLIYQNYDQEKKAFFDVFWLKEAGEISRIQTLFPYERVPTGKYVDHLVRTAEGEIIKVASVEEASFPSMRFDSKALYSAAHPARMQSLTQLSHSLCWQEIGFGMKKMSDREAELVTSFFFKLLSPLTCLLAVLGPSSFCLRFTRSLRVFFIYALSLFGMVTFFTLIKSSVILGESQILPPAIAVLTPFALALSIFGWKYAKIY